MAHDIFISHSSRDKTVADAACACLESRGLRCWIAPRDIVAGAEWGASIIAGIKGAKAMVLILSSQSNVSPQVLREVERAVNHSIPVLPLRIEDVALSESLEYYLSSSHWLDAYHGELKHHLDKLANNVAVVVEKQDAVRPLNGPPPALPKRCPLCHCYSNGDAATCLTCGIRFETDAIVSNAMTWWAWLRFVIVPVVFGAWSLFVAFLCVLAGIGAVVIDRDFPTGFVCLIVGLLFGGVGIDTLPKS